MSLTTQQQATLKAYIDSVPEWAALPNDSTSALFIAQALQDDASPDFIVWRSSVTEQEFTDDTGAEGTVWSWPAFIARSVGEQAGWNAMFRHGSVDPSKAAVRQGFLDVFSGAQNSAPAQRTHCAAIAKRKATIIEKVLATGTGTLASPATMGYEGAIAYWDVQAARSL